MISDLPRKLSDSARLLAIALQRTLWNTSDLTRRIRGLFLPRPQGKWVQELADSLVLEFPPHQTRPRLEILHQFLSHSPIWQRFLRHQRTAKKKKRVDPNYQLPAPIMVPTAGTPTTWHVQPITSPGHLAEWLGLTCGELDWFSDCTGRLCHELEGPKQHYRYRWIPKRSGGLRLLEIPKARLKSIQRQILENLLDEIEPHPAAHAYRRGRTVASYVNPHAGQGVIIHVDLSDFFTSVRWPTIHALFRTAGYPENVARLLTGLCTNVTPLNIARQHVDKTGSEQSQECSVLRQAHLPQGAPTSPALANLAAYRLDCRLHGLAEKLELHYTRYADDLLFSGSRRLLPEVSSLIHLVRKIVLQEGFTIHARKTRVMTNATRQQVSGVTLNEHPNIPRVTFDQLRALLFNCYRFGPQSQNRVQHPFFREHLQGKIAYWTTINPQRGAKLQTLFDQINWQFPADSAIDVHNFGDRRHLPPEM